MKKLTPERLKELLSYDPYTGKFTHLRTWAATAAGSIAGTLSDRGYVRIGVDGEEFRAHRLAWFYVHGEWPGDEIDHINGDRTDNRIANLRIVTHAENMQNVRAKLRRNTSGITGVSWHKARKKWRAAISINGKRYHLGLFATSDQAQAAYAAAKIRHHPCQTKFKDTHGYSEIELLEIVNKRLGVE